MCYIILFHSAVLWCSWLAHLTRKIISEMIYNVLSGTLNLLLYHTFLCYIFHLVTRYSYLLLKTFTCYWLTVAALLCYYTALVASFQMNHSADVSHCMFCSVETWNKTARVYERKQGKSNKECNWTLVAGM